MTEKASAPIITVVKNPQAADILKNEFTFRGIYNMKSRANTKLVLSGIFLLLFCVLIAALKFVDVRAIGPEGSSVGLAAINEAVHGFFGVNLVWYKITDVLGFAAIGVAGGEALRQG